MKSNYNQANNFRMNNMKKNRFILRKFFSRRVIFIPLILVMILISQKIGIFNYLVSLSLSKIYEATAKYGMKLENVYLEGQHYTSNDAIVKTLNLKIGMPILAIPIQKIQHDLENINWIKSAVVDRRFPNTLFIGITERIPIAIWQNYGKLYLVDEDSTKILEENLKPFADLVILVGDDAHLHASSLLKLLKKNAALFKHVTSAIRVGERRWNIRLDNGIEIKLPEDDIEERWNYVIRLFEKKHLFAKNISTIDLRIPNKIFIE